MLTRCNRNIAQTEICLHNTFPLNRIFTGEMKNKRKSENWYRLQGTDKIFVGLGICRKMLNSFSVLQSIFSRAWITRVQGPEEFIQCEEADTEGIAFSLGPCVRALSASPPPGLQLPALKGSTDRVPQTAMKRAVRSWGLASFASEMHLTPVVSP